MNKNNLTAQPLAPVDLANGDEDAVGHSLRILATVYNYNHWIYNLLRDYVGDAVVEVGAGIGNITRFLLNAESITCLEPTPIYEKYLTERFSAHHNVKVLCRKIQECPTDGAEAGSFDTVICLNVLEHIDNDIEALEKMRSLLKVGGKVILVVPALQWAYGALDRSMDHYRRYSKGMLKERMKAACLKPVFARYFNFPGLLGWWFQGRILKRCKIPESGTQLFDRLVPFISALETVLPPILGQSLIMVAERR